MNRLERVSLQIGQLDEFNILLDLGGSCLNLVWLQLSLPRLDAPIDIFNHISTANILEFPRMVRDRIAKRVNRERTHVSVDTSSNTVNIA